MDGIETGQIWREHSAINYGDIIRWKVIAVGRNVASLQNQATLREIALSKKRGSGIQG
jgi:hypothetical protein